MGIGRFHRAALATALFSATLSLPLMLSASPALAAHDPWIDTSDRAAVIDAYRAEFDRTEPGSGYTGDVDTCTPGTTDQVFRDSVVQRVNWYRRMAGLGIVAERAGYSSEAQQTSTMMSAEGTLSHAPDSGWGCFSSAGATTASKSNLALGVNGVNAIDAYIQDSGSGNAAVGHRRTVLYPQLLEVGTGDVEASAGHWAANTLRVFDENLWGTRPAVREARSFVSWPPSGYVPAEATWGRWSFSLAGADFSTATVAVSDALGTIQVDVIARIQASQSGGRIAPEATIAWDIGGAGAARLPEPTDGDECYSVTIAGVTVGDVQQAPFNYSTCVLDLSLESASTGTGTGAAECTQLGFSAWTVGCWTTHGTLNGYTDVVTTWQREPVAWLIANEITTGVAPGRFDPEGALTRAQAATFIWRLAGSPAPPAGSPTFDDVTGGAWYSDAVRWMAGHGITTGTSDRTFSPDAPATRAEFVTLLWRLVESPATQGSMPFIDLSFGWQADPVRWAVNSAITTGLDDDSFGPNQVVTRAQAAAFLSRFAAAFA